MLLLSQERYNEATIPYVVYIAMAFELALLLLLIELALFLLLSQERAKEGVLAPIPSFELALLILLSR
jgi:hypothetical protein